MKISWEPADEDFGPFLPFIKNNNVTDIDYQGKMLWITDLSRGRYEVKDHAVTEEFIEQFTHRIANRVNKPFNRANCVLEADTNELRITILHESIAVSGRSICIRKSLPQLRLNITNMIDSNYCPREALNLLINCVLSHINLTFCGEPGVGKTELAKFFSTFIPDSERVITIEDTPELHYGEVNPGKDYVELRINEKTFSYTDAIKICLRQNPKWIMLSEARSREVKYLLECWSTGVCGFTTLHIDDLRKLPDRIQNMIGNINDADRLENDIYEFVNIGVLIRKKQRPNGRIERFIDQLCFFEREEEVNEMFLIMEDGKIVSRKIPKSMRRKFKMAGIEEPFYSEFTIACYEGDDRRKELLYDAAK